MWSHQFVENAENEDDNAPNLGFLNVLLLIKKEASIKRVHNLKYIVQLFKNEKASKFNFEGKDAPPPPPPSN